MIISKCPLRISLIGGSTDLQAFLDKHNYGSVISFPCTLYTYITLNPRTDGCWQINYSQDEYTENPLAIKNDIAREVIKYFKLPPVTICFNADIPSTGSGLASSSSYLVALISAVNVFQKLNMSQFEICKTALEIERKFNPLTGYQDTYGCGIGGFKRICFNKNESKEINITFEYLNDSILKSQFMHLVPTDSVRSSSNVLSTINTSASVHLRSDAELCYGLLKMDLWEDFWKIFRSSWNMKKLTSPEILPKELEPLEQSLLKRQDVKGIKLCGAGGGGYFLVIGENYSYPQYGAIRINIDNKGVQTWEV